MTQYAVRNIATQIIESAVGRRDPEGFEGPLDASPVFPDGYELIPYQGPITLVGPTNTAVLRWNVTAPAWIEEGDLPAMIAAAIEQTYADNDAVTRAAVGDRVNEYAVAAADARAYAAAGYTGPVDRSVCSYAQDNGTNVAQTNEWAARAIIARADAFDWAQDEMRAKRFNFQRAMRNCSTPAELAYVLLLWDQFIAGLRAQLGL